MLLIYTKSLKLSEQFCSKTIVIKSTFFITGNFLMYFCQLFLQYLLTNTKVFDIMLQDNIYRGVV